MKKEQKQLLIFLAQMSILVVFACLYSIGGSEDFWGGQKWVRRWLATAILSGAAFAISKDWRHLAVYPLISAALTIPYGADNLWEKIGLRALFGVACAFAYNLVNILRGEWRLALFGATLCTWASIYLGVFNPTPNAIIEQGAIAMMVGFTYIIGTTKKER